MSVNGHWHNSRFEALTAAELYAVLQLRQDIFVVEQACVYRDLDGLDADSWHMRCVSGELVQRGIDFNLGQWPAAGIAIGAQAYLRSFYASLGFVAAGEPYLEDGIFHIHMQFKPGQIPAGTSPGHH